MTARAVLRSADGRLRAPWRLLIFGLVAVLFATVAQGIVALTFPASREGEVLEADDVISPGAIAFYWLLALALVAAHAVMLRAVERRPWSFTWMDRGAARPTLLATGFFIGALAVGVPSALLIAAGWLDVIDAPGTWAADALALSMFLLPAALVEELMMRGYPLAVLREALGPVWALVLTSVTFGVLHAWNSNASAEALMLVSVAGIFLGFIVFATGSLFAATAAHFAWNATLAVALHAAVSGEELPGGDYRVIDSGPDWATGGAWGPEGGAGAVAGMVLVAAVLYRRARRRPSEAA